MNTLKDHRFLGAIIAGIILSLITFPSYDLSIEAGIDPPLKWVFSHFAATGFEHADYINFPHGPLAFFMYPLANTVLITVIFTFLLKTLFIFLALKLYRELCIMRWVHILITAYVVFAIGSINHLIIADVLLAYLVFYRTRNNWYKLTGLLLTAIALYIKSYVGILTGLISLSLILYMALRYRKYLQSFLDGFILIGFYYAMWIFLFGKLSGFFTYLYGMRLLAEDNSSAAAYYPENNWWLLSVFLLIVFLIPFYQRIQRARFFGAITLLSLFGAWKHGMAREDIFHVNGLFVYVSIIYLLFLLFHNKKRILNTVLIVAALYCFSINSENAYNYVEPRYNWWGISNIAKINKNSDNKLSHHQLPDEDIQMIKTSTVDVYPWDYSIIAANNLNWKPRPVLHSYAAYTPWLDQRNADHFQSLSSARYIIWEKDKISSDLYQGQLQSIDQRYLLNNEPKAILSIIANYKKVSDNERFMILKKRSKKLEYRIDHSKTAKGKIGRWISVPKTKSDLLRLNVEFNKNLSASIKSFLYKDEQFWILYRTEDGRILKHRIVPKNAESGLWINPFIESFNDNKDLITSFQIISSGADTEFDFNWTTIIFDKKNVIPRFFNLSEKTRKSMIISKQNYELETNAYWSSPINTEKEGKNNYEILDSEYSSTFEINIDSTLRGKFKVYAQVDLKALTTNNTKLIISHETENGVWASFDCSHQIIRHDDWNLITGAITIDLQNDQDRVKVYLHNPEKHKVALDNFEIFLVKELTTD